MVSISLKQDQYKTYILTDDSANSQLEVVPERGGIITKWRVNGKEIFYLDEERYTNRELSVRGGNPILFPICGNLPDNTYTANGKQYTLKQHGFARDLPWSPEEVKTEDSTFLKVHLTSNEQTHVVYPFDFDVVFSYQIKGNTLEVRQYYHNASSTPMPFSFGFHPYFAVEDKNKLEIEIPSHEYFDNKTKQKIAYNGNFDFNQDEIDAAFGHLSKTEASVTNRDRKLKLTLKYDDVFSTLVFWTVKGKDFYCLEPWSAGRNAMNTKENLTVLEPGASYATSIKLTANFF